MLTCGIAGASACAKRSGTTLPELLVSLTLFGALMAVVSDISLREQRFLRNVDRSVAVNARLRETRSVLPLDLRALAPGDVRAQEARDTSLEVRAVIASALVCDTAADELVLAAETADSVPFASFQRDPSVGDTAWLLVPSEGLEWKAAPIASARLDAPAPCAASLAFLGSGGRPQWRVRLAPDTAAPAPSPGAVVRITRPIRYATYRASDGSWYLGVREWNPPLARFDVIQPIAGPLASGVRGFRIQYFDSAGVELSPGSAEVSRLASLRFTLRATSPVARMKWLAVPSATMADSGSFTVRLRNAP